jgi:tetratricopeptide (TPR) repeat protein
MKHGTRETMMAAADPLSRLEAQIDSGDIPAAIRTAQAMLETSGDEIDLVKCGKLLERAQELELARLAYEKALRVAPEFSPAYSALGLLALSEGDNVQAVHHFDEAVRFEPGDAGKLTLLGVAYARSGEETKAAEWLRKALQIDPAYEEANYNLGFLLRDTEPDEAKACFLKALEGDPEYGLAHRELGWLLAIEPSNPESEYHLRRAIELNPKDAWAHVYLANHFWDRGDRDAALEEFNRAVELAPEAAFPLRALGNVYEEGDDWQQAQYHYERALELEPDNAVVNMNMARMLKKKGDLATAKVFAERALLLDPDYEAARRLLTQLSRDLLEQRSHMGTTAGSAVSRGASGAAPLAARGDRCHGRSTTSALAIP